MYEEPCEMPAAEHREIAGKGKKTEERIPYILAVILLFAGALLASQILVIGEDGPERDSRNLHCIEVLRVISEKSPRDIHCHLLLCEPSTSEVLWFLKAPEKRKDHLLVDVFNEYEFMSEQLLVGTDFLPTIRESDNQRLHVVLIGTGPIAQAVAFAVANICHYPNYKRTNLKTCKLD